jgi:hypothetical protein
VGRRRREKYLSHSGNLARCTSLHLLSYPGSLITFSLVLDLRDLCAMCNFGSRSLSALGVETINIRRTCSHLAFSLKMATVLKGEILEQL